MDDATLSTVGQASGLPSDVELRVASSESDNHGTCCWYTLSGVVDLKGEEAAKLLEIVAVLRSAGASDINITPLTLRFKEESLTVRALHERVQRRN